ncbi:Adagio protein 3 [Tritrichomonas musculus]|uniref:Adagio protein 3 n=1 Tax=Tritrichomonas musculus TaxID=1915356 RepID=A0ABR2KC21_9EUKA
MIDVITKPSLQEINNYSNETLISSSDIRPPQCFHIDSFFLCTSELWYFQRSQPLQWKKESQLPFQKRQGQSMTSTPSGIVFFGGQSDLLTYNDLWIYNKGQWSYVTCDIPARANHAAACDKNGRLVICGGTTENQAVLHDLYVIDLKTQKVKELKIPDFPPVSHEHSLTLLPDGTFVLFGGEMKLSSDNKVQSIEYNMYILDLEKKTVNKIETDFQNKIDSHFTAVIYGMLFVFGGSDRKVWMFNFDHHVWIPFSLPKFNNNEFRPYYVFSSFLFTEDKCLHLVSDDFKKLATVPVFGEPPPSDPYILKNHPHFIHFLRTNLIKAHDFFKEYEPSSKEVLPEQRVILDQVRSRFRQKNEKVKIVPDKSVENIYKLIDTLNAIEYLMLHAKKIQKLMEFSSLTSNIDLSKDRKQDEEAFLTLSEQKLNQLISVHQVIVDIQNLMILRAKELKPLNEQCESLIRDIENSTFFTLSEAHSSSNSIEEQTDSLDLQMSTDEKKKKKKKAPSSVPPDSSKRTSRHDRDKRSSRKASEFGSKHSSLSFEQLAEDSKQLAHTISFERQRYENEMKSQNIKDKENEISSIQQSDVVLNILDQLCNVSQREIHFMSQIRPVCDNFFNVLSDLTNLRESELTIDDEATRALSTKLSKIKNDEKMMKKLKVQLENTLNVLSTSINELSTVGNKNKQQKEQGNNEADKPTPVPTIRKNLSFELLGNEIPDDDEQMFVTKQKIRLENQIQLLKPLKKVEKAISDIGEWIQDADPIIGTKATRDLVNSTVSSFKGDFNLRLMNKPANNDNKPTSSIIFPKFKSVEIVKENSNKEKDDKSYRPVSASIYQSKKQKLSLLPADDNPPSCLADLFTPFDDSAGNEMTFVDDLEKVLTRIELNIYQMNPISKI